jgi:hypothetical protein
MQFLWTLSLEIKLHKQDFQENNGGRTRGPNI